VKWNHSLKFWNIPLAMDQYRTSRSIPGSKPGVTGRILGFYDHELVYTTPGLLAMDRILLSQTGKRIFAQE